MRTALALATVALSLTPCAARADTGPLPLDTAHWALSGDARIEPYLGRTALRMRFGGAEARDIALLDGTVEFDLAVGTHRSFPFVDLRKRADGRYEEFYLRTHKSELPDAVQYVPVWQENGGWQLYHGPGFTAPATFPRDQWFHVRIEVSGSKAAVFVGGTDRPQLVVSRLRHEPRAGAVAFQAIAPGTPPDGEFTTNISNVVIRPGEVSYEFSSVHDTPTAPPGIVADWQVSEPFVPTAGLGAGLRDRVVAEDGWRAAAAEPSGLLVLDQYVKRAPEGQPSVTLARVVVNAETAGTRIFHVGYSDVATVFLNGTPLFTGDAHYSFDNPRQEGLIALTQGALYLPLHKGRNVIVVAVADVFGGWGVMGQFEDMGGLAVESGRGSR